LVVFRLDITNSRHSHEEHRMAAIRHSRQGIALLKPLRYVVHTITAANRKEFAYHEKISDSLEADVYFAHPYSSQERGLNENTNGLLRQYFPKSTDFRQVTQLEVKRVVKCLNT